MNHHAHNHASLQEGETLYPPQVAKMGSDTMDIDGPSYYGEKTSTARTSAGRAIRIGWILNPTSIINYTFGLATATWDWITRVQHNALPANTGISAVVTGESGRKRRAVAFPHSPPSSLARSRSSPRAFTQSAPGYYPADESSLFTPANSRPTTAEGSNLSKCKRSPLPGDSGSRFSLTSSAPSLKRKRTEDHQRPEASPTLSIMSFETMNRLVNEHPSCFSDLSPSAKQSAQSPKETERQPASPEYSTKSIGRMTWLVDEYPSCLSDVSPPAKKSPQPYEEAQSLQAEKLPQPSKETRPHSAKKSPQPFKRTQPLPTPPSEPETQNPTQPIIKAPQRPHSTMARLPKHLEEERRKCMLPESYKLGGYNQPFYRAPKKYAGESKEYLKMLSERPRPTPRTVEQRDANIDALILRARKVQIDSGKIARVRRNKYFERDFKANVEEAEAKKAKLEERAAANKAAEEQVRELLCKDIEEAEKKDRLEKDAQEKLRKQQKALEKAAQEELLRKQKLIRPLNDDWAVKVKEVMAVSNPEKAIVAAPDGNDLTRRSFGTLLARGNEVASAWLNDEMVNAFIESAVARYLEKNEWRSANNNSAPVASYPSHWFSNVKSKGVVSIKRWSKRKHIQGAKLLHAEKIFFPINTGAHWMLLIISPMDRKIEVLDSLHGSKKRYFDIARDWIAMELGNLYKAAEWTESTATSSMQANSDDCGVFTCFNMLASITGREFDEIQQKDMQDGRRMIAAILVNGGMNGDWEL